MGIECRRGNPYYYRKVRRGDRVVSEYVGGGLLGLAGAMLDEEKRLERAEADAAWREERGRMEAENRVFADDFDRVEAEARRILAEAGYHRTRGEWRKGRGRRDDAG